MLIFLALISFVIGGTFAAEPDCHLRVKNVTKILYNTQCPRLMRLTEDQLSSYIKCVHDYGYTLLYDAYRTCTKQRDRTEVSGREIMAKCCVTDESDINAVQKSEELMCCLISEEIRPTDKTGLDKASASQACLDRIK